jgi:hypothetical protein
VRDPSEGPVRRVREATAFKPRILTCPHNYKERRGVESERRKQASKQALGSGCFSALFCRVLLPFA